MLAYDLVTCGDTLATFVRRRAPIWAGHRLILFFALFADRAAFDGLARRLKVLYGLARDGDDAAAFRATLNGRLRDLGQAPVAFDNADGVNGFEIGSAPCPPSPSWSSWSPS